jgi:hypothetical protein
MLSENRRGHRVFQTSRKTGKKQSENWKTEERRKMTEGQQEISHRNRHQCAPRANRNNHEAKTEYVKNQYRNRGMEQISWSIEILWFLSILSISPPSEDTRYARVLGALKEIQLEDYQKLLDSPGYSI